MSVCASVDIDIYMSLLYLLRSRFSDTLVTTSVFGAQVFVSKYYSPIKGRMAWKNLLIPGPGQGKYKMNLE